jgi:hypothetical protein
LISKNQKSSIVDEKNNTTDREIHNETGVKPSKKNKTKEITVKPNNTRCSMFCKAYIGADMMMLFSHYVVMVHYLQLWDNFNI